MACSHTHNGIAACSIPCTARGGGGGGGGVNLWFVSVNNSSYYLTAPFIHPTVTCAMSSLLHNLLLPSIAYVSTVYSSLSLYTHVQECVY